MAIEVFLADDHGVVRDGLRFILEAEGDIRIVGEASDGCQAVRKIQQVCPNVAIIDIAMPGLNGIEATAQIRETCRHTQVAILSMHSSREYVFRAIDAGAKAYLLKELAGQEVVAAVRAVQSGRYYLCNRISEMVIDDYLRPCQAGRARSPLEKLSGRELGVLQLVVNGKTSSEIADSLSLSPKTVETYRSRLMQKLGISNITSLVKFAIRHGLTSVE
jgi:DNA-binding NarL/FixJ family response regulator